MGIVYAAYDEVLDRRLAIKVLNVWDIDGRRRERLLREAQALARVTHPNVITVHDVGTTDDQLFVAMEFVAGPTLDEWLELEKRSWREIVAVFRQIADGLAAIHEAGLVHRDVKPSNVMIGEDGRARVLDLGLATTGRDELLTSTAESAAETTAETPEPDSVSSSSRRAASLTKTGERVGTPAYMSPEQFLGRELTAASDIFSLSVALYQALHGIHPFLAKSFYALQENVVKGRIAPPPSSSAVPAWLHTLVLRGLATDPKDRPASMRELSAALGRDPSRVRRRWITTIGVAALAAITAVVVTQARTPVAVPICDGSATAIAAIWSSERAAEIHAAMLASARPYAKALAGRITDALDDYAESWTAAHQRTCLEHARGEHSDALLDARMACLDKRRAALAETVTILAEADDDVVENAGQLVAKLPRLAPCDDLAALSVRRPPSDPAHAAEIAALESRLVRAEALANAGRIDEATSIARAVAAEAEVLDQPELLVNALLGEARMSIVLGYEYEPMIALLTRALEVAIEDDLQGLAAEAMIRRLYVRGLDNRSGREAARADLPLAEAMVARAGNDPELRALLLNNAGAIHLAAGDREAARVAFERSLAIKERLFGTDHLELALGLANLGMLTDDAEARSALHGRMIDIYARQLGPDHPRTLDARWLAAIHTVNPEAAVAALDELCPRLLAVDELEFAGECELEQGRLELARGRLDLAQRAFTAARGHLGDANQLILLDGYLGLGAEPARVQPVIVALRELITTFDGREDRVLWWVRQAQAERRLVLARLLAATGAPAAGVADLERALEDLQAITEQAQPIERERQLALTQAALAFALAADGSNDRSRVARLAAAARAYYGQWPRTYALRLDELASLQSMDTEIPLNQEALP